jgi:ATP-dependent RNA helicase DDX42
MCCPPCCCCCVLPLLLAGTTGLRAVAAFGGLSKFEQFKELKSGCEIAVATPGRMMDLIRMKACTTQRVTYLVLDEADRMFDMGFEQQVRVRV